MRQFITFIITASILIGLMNACGPSEEELERQEQARQDSIEQARQDSIEQARLDSIEQARQDSIAAAEEEERKRNEITFDENGHLSVQVEAWRSEVKAEEQLSKWKDRGYENAFVTKHGKEETGDIWFRVQLGKFSSKEMAEKFQEVLREDYDAKSWISNAPESGSN